MDRRRHAQLHLPPLSPPQALTVVTVLERAIAAIVRAHGADMRDHREMPHAEVLGHAREK